MEHYLLSGVAAAVGEKTKRADDYDENKLPSNASPRCGQRRRQSPGIRHVGATAESDAGAVTVTIVAVPTKRRRRSKKRRTRAKRASAAANTVTVAPNETTANPDMIRGHDADDADDSSEFCKTFFGEVEKLQANLTIAAEEVRRMDAVDALARRRMMDLAHSMEALADCMATTALSPGPSPDDKAKNRAARRSLMKLGKDIAQARAIVGGDYDDDDARDDEAFMEALDLLTDGAQRKLFFKDDNE